MQHDESSHPSIAPEQTTTARRRLWLWILASSLAVALTLGAILVPIPIFFVYLPGPLRDVERLIEVEGAKTYSSEGHLYLTTVSVDVDVTFLDWLIAVVDPQRAVILRSQLTRGRSLERLEEQQRREIQDSKRRAREVVLSALGLGKPESSGVEVVATVRGAPAQGVIKPGDEIASIGERRITTTCDVTRAVSGYRPGQEVMLRLRRDGEVEAVRLRTEENPFEPGSAFLGIQMRDVGYELDTGVTATFRTGRIGGPSAGLMFSLALYDRLTPGDLTAGRSIAGTGTIGCFGEVGAIGGIEEKIAAAEREGAEIFLSPKANARDARRAADDLKVIAVTSFDDAVRDLQALN